MEANDGPALRALFAADAWQAYGNGSPKSGAAFFAWLESDIIKVQCRVHDAKVTAQGEDAVITGQYRNNSGYRSAANFLISARDGRITGWRMRY